MVLQARAKELRFELLNSKRLQAHFEEHPADLALLKHDKPLAKTAAAAHLKQLPGYLRDAAGVAKVSYSGNRGRGAYVPPTCQFIWQQVLCNLEKAISIRMQSADALIAIVSFVLASKALVHSRCAA